MRYVLLCVKEWQNFTVSMVCTTTLLKQQKPVAPMTFQKRFGSIQVIHQKGAEKVIKMSGVQRVNGRSKVI